MMVGGVRTRFRDRVSLSTLTQTSMRESFMRIEQMDMVGTYKSVEKRTKDTGPMINPTDKENLPLKTAQSMKENSKMD